MSKLSTARKFGVAARVATQMATQSAKRSRTLSAMWSAVKATARSFGHVLHMLWLEVIGTLFLAMAGIGGIALVREYVKYQGHRATAGRIVVAVLFTLTFAWFGVSSFWRVRQKSRGAR
ncbi:MAG: hypothetical protein LAO24_19210 [Acidobacteriia bacterium]|nr:hypothetical protein [Terriglobia bacterium]